MARWNVYSCDRCGKEMKIGELQEPIKLIIKETSSATSCDLCEDCRATLSFWMEYPKRFDNLASQICDEKEGVE